MAKARTISYRRDGKTNYKARLKLLAAGVPRLVVRPSLHHTLLQAVEYGENGDRIIAHAHTNELKSFGWSFSTGNTPSAYLAGMLLGKRLKGKTPKLIADLGYGTMVKGARIFAAVKGVVDGGVEVPHDDSVFPSADRLAGKHIANQKDTKHDYTALPATFEKVRKAIAEGADGKGK